MRRHEKEIIDTAELESIINEAVVCRLGLTDGTTPYVVPLSFGYAASKLYFHCATDGRKIDMIRANPKVCFEFDTHVSVIESAEKPCSWGMAFKSIIGTGTAVIVDDAREKIEGLNRIMAHYSDASFEFPDKALEKTLVIRVDIQEMTGKKSGQ